MLDLFSTIDVLTVQEANRKAELEATIERGMQTFVEVGLALMEIRDERLYRAEFGTFEEYCRSKWGWGRSHAYRLIDAAQVVGNVSDRGQITSPANIEQTRPLAPLSPELQREAWREAVDTAPNGKVTAAHVQAVVDKMLHTEQDEDESDLPDMRYTVFGEGGYEETLTVGPDEEIAVVKKYPTIAANHAETEGDDWCTPIEYVDAVREVLGTIDLDPATNEYGQSIIGAFKFYTKQDDGLAHEWRGRVFLNPPYSVPMIDRFASKLLAEYMTGNVTEAIVLTNNSTETQWFQGLLAVCQSVCFPARRLKFWKNGNEVFATRQGQAFFYFGTSEKFAKVFSDFGTVLIKYDNQ